MCSSNRHLLRSLRRSEGAICVRDSAAREFGKRRSEAKIALKSSYIVLIFLLTWLPFPLSVAYSNYAYGSHADAQATGTAGNNVSRVYVYRDHHNGSLTSGDSPGSEPVIDLSDLQFVLDLQLTAFIIGTLSIVTNPIVYGLSIRSFRVALLKLLRNDWNKARAKCHVCL